MSDELDIYANQGEPDLSEFDDWKLEHFAIENTLVKPELTKQQLNIIKRNVALLMDKPAWDERVQWFSEMVDRETDLDARKSIIEQYYVCFQQAVFVAEKGILNFSGRVFPTEVDFGGVEFSGGDASFAAAKFSGGDANFRAAKFSGGDANFDGAWFASGTTDFKEAMFVGRQASFRKVQFLGDKTTFENTSFSGGSADFEEAVFSGKQITFSGVEFSGGEANFVDAHFSGGDVSFDCAMFSGGAAQFEWAEFSGGDVTFRSAIFDHHAVFRRAIFSGGAVDFQKVDFNGPKADFSYAKAHHNFRVTHNFLYEKTNANASFDFTYFEVDGRFDFSTIECSYIDFYGASFGSIAEFSSENVSSVPDFRGAKFDRPPHLSKLSINEKPKLDLFYPKSDQVLVNKWRVLKSLAIDASDHEKAGQFFAKEMAAKRGTEIQGIIPLAFTGIYMLFSGFGQSYLRPIISLSCVWFGAAFII